MPTRRSGQLIQDALEGSLDCGAAPARAVADRPSGARRRPDLALEEAVNLALEQNLDIQVARLEPQSVDLQVAGFNNTYRPTLASTVGQRDLGNSRTTTLRRRHRVTQRPPPTTSASASRCRCSAARINLDWTNQRLETSNLRATSIPASRPGSWPPTRSRSSAGSRSTTPASSCRSTLINRDISEQSARATVVQTVANVRNAYWDLVFARSAVDVARRALELADKLVVDNQARVEVGTLAPLDIVQAQAEAATRRQTLAAAEATASTADLSLKRFLVSGTKIRCGGRKSCRWTAAARAAPTLTSRARCAAPSRNAPTSRPRARTSTRNDVNLRFFRNQSLPALDLTASYGAQGLGGTAFRRSGTGADSVITGARFPAATATRSRPVARVASSRSGTSPSRSSYPLMGNQAEAQLARARVQRQQAQTRMRALEVQIAAEVANAAFTVQATCGASRRRVRRASWPKAARRRTEPVRGRTDHQLLRGPGAARFARRREHGTARPGRLPQVARQLRARAAGARGRRRRRRNFRHGDRTTGPAANAWHRGGTQSGLCRRRTENGHHYMRKVVIIGALLVVWRGGAAAYFGVFPRGSRPRQPPRGEARAADPVQVSQGGGGPAAGPGGGGGGNPARRSPCRWRRPPRATSAPA